MPRFSLLTLLCITAYIAVIAGAMVRPEGWVLAASRIAWLAVVVYWIARAAQPAQMPKTSFARAAIVGAIAYLFVANSATFTWLPHHALADWLGSRYVMQQLPAAIDSTPSSKVVSLPSASRDEVVRSIQAIQNKPADVVDYVPREPADNDDSFTTEELDELLGGLRIEYINGPDAVVIGDAWQDPGWEALKIRLRTWKDLVLLQTALAIGLAIGAIASLIRLREQRSAEVNATTPTR